MSSVISVVKGFDLVKKILCFLLLFVAPVSAVAASGIEGRVAWRGQLVEGVRVHAYRAIADIAAGGEVAVSPPVDVDGTYRLELPPGNYYLVARDFEGEPREGGYFCYYSGAPVRVENESFSQVGFNLIRIPEQVDVEQGGSSGIEGEITFQDELLERCYLYVYTDPERGFKGPGYVIAPVEKGRFRLRLPPGEYWILARKRAAGGRFGPIEIGDYFNFYYGNPVRVGEGEMHSVHIETITRLDMLEKGDAPFRGVSGRILDSEGRPVSGVRVFAYQDQAMTGTPAAMSAPSGEDGLYRLPLSAQGPWYFLARESLGGPAGPDELQGRYQGGAGSGVSLSPENPSLEVDIHVRSSM